MEDKTFLSVLKAWDAGLGAFYSLLLSQQFSIIFSKKQDP